jgi:hypothetical protein
LTKCFRQSDPIFANALNEIRFGECSDDTFRLFQSCTFIDPAYSKGLKPMRIMATNKEVDLIIKFINKELAFLRKNKKNITRYLYLENIKGKILFLDFQRMVEEIQRIGVEIQFLEEKRLEYFKIQEKQQQL